MARTGRGLRRGLRALPDRWWVLVAPGSATVVPGSARPTTSRTPWQLRWGRPLRLVDGASGDLGPGAPHGRVALVLPDVSALQAIGHHAIAATTAHQVRIDIGRWEAPIRGWVGRLGPIHDLRRSEVRVPRFAGRVRVTVELASERPLREVVAAVECLLLPGAPLPMTHGASLGSQGRLPAWVPLGADTTTRFVLPPGSVPPEGVDPVSGRTRGPEDPPPNRPAVDVELVMGRSPSRPVGLGVIPVLLASDAGVVRRPDPEVVTPNPPCGTSPVPVDVRAERRPWTMPSASDRDVVLELATTGHGTRWRVRERVGDGVADGRRPDPTRPVGPWQDLGSPLGSPLGPASDVGWRTLAWQVGDGVEPGAAAAAVVRSALSGMLVDGRGLPPDVRRRLAPELAGIVAEALPPPDDALAWERRSVRQRRAAIRGHATPLVMDAAIRPDAAIPARPPEVSALLVTRRPALALAALRALERQTYPSLEVVLAFHGVEPDADQERRIRESPLPMQRVAVPASATLGEALGLATARARGSLVTKVDDDDVYGPEHVWDLVAARLVAGATVVGKPAQFVLLEQRGITVRRDRPSADVYGRVVAGGTILLARGELEAMGGWRPVRSGVDRALLDRVLQWGGTIYQASPFGFIYRRHGKAHTWDVSDGYFLRGVTQRWQGIPDLPEFGATHGADHDDSRAVHDRLT